MTGDPRFLDWARRIGDAYVLEVLPGSFGVPAMTWNFDTHTGERRLRLRDHGNETVVGLVMLFTLEHELGTPRAAQYRPVLKRMLDRILAVGQRGWPALQRSRPRHLEAARHRPVGQLGLRLRRGLRVLSGDGRADVSRRGAARARQPAEVSQARLGAAARPRRSARSTATPTPSRARSIWPTASRWPRRSTGSTPRWR